MKRKIYYRRTLSPFPSFSSISLRIVLCRFIVKKIKALLKRFGAPGALQYLTFFLAGAAAFFVSDGKADGMGAARAAAAAAVAAALTPPALAVAVALLPKVNPPGGGGTGGRLGGPKVEGSGGGPAAAATGAGAGAAGGAGAGCAAAAAPMTPSSLRPVPVLTVEEASLSTLMPYLDAMSPAVCMSLGTSMEFGWDEIDPSGCQFGVRLRCYCNTNVLTVVVVV
jgi:hypothetical protein